jgi:hypothetical protein
MGDTIKEWAPVVVGVLGTVVGLVGIAIGTYFNRQTLNQKRIEDERKEIYKKLNSFYGPCVLLLRISTQYSDILRTDKDQDFSVLMFFLSGEQFVGNDAALYERINSTTNAIDDLIRTNSGLVDRQELRALLSRASAHFGVINLAYSGKLEGEAERFLGHKYPVELTQELEAEIARLNARLSKLNGLES